LHDGAFQKLSVEL
jgi:hypothetical protein